MKYQGTPTAGNFTMVNILPPSTNATGSSNLASDVVYLKDYYQADVFIQFSTHAGGGVLTVYGTSDNVAGTSNPLAFNYAYTTQLTDQFSTQYTATSSGVSLGTADNAVYRFSVNQDMLSTALPAFYFTLTGSTGQSVAASARLSGARYFRQPMPSAL